MFTRSVRQSLVAWALGGVLAGIFALPVRADLVVQPGWDLFATQPGTTFPGLGPLMGVPLGTFDFDNVFGRGLGVQSVGDTDTIVQRLDVASVPGPVPPAQTAPPIRIAMPALQLETVVPVNFGGNGLDNYFITLQSARGGPTTIGQMTITFAQEGIPEGTFNSSLDVFFDIRKGALNGPIVFSSDLVLTQTGTPWEHPPTPGALVINGVNHNLDGTNENQDFWPIGLVVEQHPNGSIHIVRSTIQAVPEPGSMTVWVLGLALAAGIRSRRRK